MLSRVNSPIDKVCVETVFNIVVMRRGNNSVNEIRSNIVTEGGLECILHISRARRRSDYPMSRVIRTQRADQVLA